MKHCCFCGDVIEGYGNNPDGALSISRGKVVDYLFGKEDRCCDFCDNVYVINGRIKRLYDKNFAPDILKAKISAIEEFLHPEWCFSEGTEELKTGLLEELCRRLYNKKLKKLTIKEETKDQVVVELKWEE